MDLDLAIKRLQADQSTEERKLMLTVAKAVQEDREARQQPAGRQRKTSTAKQDDLGQS